MKTKLNQQLDNLPQIIFDLPRFVKTRSDNPKAPAGANWQDPANQKLCTELDGIRGFVAATERDDSLVFVDFDHALDDDGEFVSGEAESWFNRLGGGKYYAEFSQSRHGLHMFLKPDDKNNSKVFGKIYLTDDKQSFIEVFYRTNKFCLVTGACFNCAPHSDIATGEVADKMLAELQAELETEKAKKIAAKQSKPEHTAFVTANISTTDNPEYDQFRAAKMLGDINPSALDYNQWLAVVSSCKNIGLPYSAVDAFNQRDPERYDENTNLKHWQSVNNPSFDIETLHGIAKNFGYSERDTRREWYQLHPEFQTSEPEVEPEPEEVYLSSADYDLISTTADDDSNYFRGDLSDEDFAIRLESFCGANVRWLTDDNKWAVYRDGVWHIHSDKKSAVLPCARDLSSTLTKFARSADDKKIAKCFKSTVKQSAAITLLTGAHAIRITSTDLDNHSELLNALNGVVDLQTGKLYPHYSQLLLTQQVNAIYDSGAKSETVDKFFSDIQPDISTRNGLLRWLGYCLTGETREEKFMVWYGTGANGKGLLSGTLLELLGNYGCGLTPRALLKKSKLADDSDRATTALNPLRTSRFAISEEVPSDAELDCSILKNLTGGDRFNLRKNFGEYESVKLAAKLNISGNYLPRIENINDGGMLRRLLNMPFTVQFGTAEHPRDDQLKAKMIQPENLSALLAILVREAGYWYKEGLIISDEMQSETRRHLSENNFIADFIDDNGYVIDLKSSELIVNVKRFLDDLRAEYPREVSRFKRADLIKMVERVTGAVYTSDKHRHRIFRGIGKVSDSSHDDFFGGEPINPEDVPI